MGGRLPLQLVLLAVVALSACDGARRGRALLAQGRPREALLASRPVSAATFVVRARALRRLGRLQQARTELLLALSLDRRCADAFAVLGLVEAQLGRRGAAVAALEEALRIAPHRPCLRRELSRLLLWRAWYRLHPGPGLRQLAEARADLERVRALNPCLWRAMAPTFARLRQPAPRVALPECPGVPPLPANRATPRGRCTLRGASRLVRSLLGRELLLGCRGAQLALRLEAHGCLAAAHSVWGALAREAPGDARWPLQAARVLFLQGHEARAEMQVMNHVFLSSDRADAMLSAARMLEGVGRKRRAARRASEALPLAKRLEQQLEALRILRRTGSGEQIRQAKRVVKLGGWELPASRLRQLIQAATSATR